MQHNNSILVKKALKIIVQPLLSAYNRQFDKTDEKTKKSDSVLLKKAKESSVQDLPRTPGIDIYVQKPNKDKEILGNMNDAIDAHSQENKKPTIRTMRASFKSLGIPKKKSKIFLHSLNQIYLTVVMRLPSLYASYTMADKNNTLYLSSSEFNKSKIDIIKHCCPSTSNSIFTIDSSETYSIKSTETEKVYSDILVFNLVFEIEIDKDGKAKIEYKNHTLLLNNESINTIKAAISKNNKKILIINKALNKKKHCNKTTIATCIMLPTTALVAILASIYAAKYNTHKEGKMLHSVMFISAIATTCVVMAIYSLTQRILIKKYLKKYKKEYNEELCLPNARSTISNLQKEERELAQELNSLNEFIDIFLDLDQNSVATTERSERRDTFLEDLCKCPPLKKKRPTAEEGDIIQEEISSTSLTESKTAKTNNRHKGLLILN